VFSIFQEWLDEFQGKVQYATADPADNKTSHEKLRYEYGIHDDENLSTMAV
jgi:hypothetical protein